MSDPPFLLRTGVGMCNTRLFTCTNYSKYYLL